MKEPRWLNPNKPSRIYTIGYGISTEEEFINRLKLAFPDGDAEIVDIRKEGSGSRNAGSWANWGIGMAGTCLASGNKYSSFPELSNPHGNTRKGLARYEEELNSGALRPHLDSLVSGLKYDPETNFCLLCCERKPFTGRFSPRTIVEGIHIGWESWTGSANCHRVVVARYVHYRMRYDHNLEWFSKHLYTEQNT